MKDFHSQKGAEMRKLLSMAKNSWLLQGHFPLGDARRLSSR